MELIWRGRGKLYLDEFYDRGSTFPLLFFWMTGFLNPKSLECQIAFEK